eukprot:2077197-Rhodomonas_salina.1
MLAPPHYTAPVQMFLPLQYSGYMISPPSPSAMHPLHVPAPKPPDDAERVSVLRGLALLDSERELCFDR